MSKIEKAVILAAGRGTRMRELTADLPKPMIEVRGKPVLQHIVEGLRDAGICEFLIVVGYRGDTVRNFLGDGSRYNIAIRYATQTVQDGTGRVVDLARDFVGDSAFVLSYGDILVDPANYKCVINLPDNAEAIITVNAFRPSIFEFTGKLKPSPRGEYELTDAIRDLARSGKKVKALELTGEWADVRDPEILARLNRNV